MKLDEALRPEFLKSWISSALSEAGVSIEEFLADDKMIERISIIAYGRIPLFPYRTLIKATLGQKGFTKLVFNIRNVMIQTDTRDLSRFSAEKLKSLI